MNTLSVLVFLCISLPVDGTDWGATFGHWRSTEWLALIGLSSAAYLGSGMCMQLCVWKLGAPTAGGRHRKLAGLKIGVRVRGLAK